jgi:hypothetical protein
VNVVVTDVDAIASLLLQISAGDFPPVIDMWIPENAAEGA